MSSTFTMNVGNDSADQLNNVLVIHCCNENTSAISLDSMSAYETSANVTCQTYDAHNDYYLIQFVRNGNVYQANCYCNSDSDSNSMQVQLQTDIYNINYNDTSCTNKSYNYSTST
jgi:hypothetical protein